MFTGLVEAMGTVVRLRDAAEGRRLTISSSLFAPAPAIGDSVAINGCCLTVVAVEGKSADFQAGPETLARTNLRLLATGARVNLERAMRADGRLGGHFVQGHIDGVGTVRSRQSAGDWHTFWFNAGPLARLLVPKGSVAVDGVSLTVVEVTADAFSVALIPHTLAATTLGQRQPGDSVNLEADIIGKYVLKFLQQIGEGLTLEKLLQAGFAE